MELWHGGDRMEEVVEAAAVGARDCSRVGAVCFVVKLGAQAARSQAAHLA